MFKPFVANRVKEIQSSSSPDQWRYFPTKLNPTDYLIKLSELATLNTWWEGPEFWSYYTNLCMLQKKLRKDVLGQKSYKRFNYLIV